MYFVSPLLSGLHGVFPFGHKIQRMPIEGEMTKSQQQRKRQRTDIKLLCDRLVFVRSLERYEHAWQQDDPRSRPTSVSIRLGAKTNCPGERHRCQTSGWPHSAFASCHVAAVFVTAQFREFDSGDRTAASGRWKSASATRLYMNEGIENPARLTASTAQQRRVMEQARVVEHPTRCNFDGEQTRVVEHPTRCNFDGWF